MSDLNEQFILEDEAVQVIETLELDHTSFSNPKRLAAATDDADLPYYSAAGKVHFPLTSGAANTDFDVAQFVVRQPQKTEAGRQEIEVSLPLTNSSIIELVDEVGSSWENLLDPVTATYRIYFAHEISDGPKPPTPLTLRVIQASIADIALVLTLSRAILTGRKAPRTVYNAANSPGLVR